MVLLRIDKLTVSVGEKRVLSEMSMSIEQNEIHALMGANGSGKSSLANVLMGSPSYDTQSGTVTFVGKDLLTMTSDERSRAGLYVAWQNPITIPGVSVFSMCKASYESLRQAQGKPSEFRSLVLFKNHLEKLAVRVGLTKDYVGRGVNEGFSGGERKRLELLQLLLLKPKLAILDEIDSGLDAKGVKILVTLMQEMKGQGTSFLLITHNKRLLEELSVDKVWKITN